MSPGCDRHIQRVSDWTSGSNDDIISCNKRSLTGRYLICKHEEREREYEVSSNKTNRL